MTTQPIVPVTQADREAAAKFYEKHLALPGEVPVAAAMRMRHIDESPLIIAFARHAAQARQAEREACALIARSALADYVRSVKEPTFTAASCFVRDAILAKKDQDHD